MCRKTWSKFKYYNIFWILGGFRLSKYVQWHIPIVIEIPVIQRLFPTSTAMNQELCTSRGIALPSKNFTLRYDTTLGTFESQMAQDGVLINDFRSDFRWYYLNKKTYKTSSPAKTFRMQLTVQISFRDFFFRSLLSQILIPSTAKILSICWGTFPDKSVGSLGPSFFRSGSGGDQWFPRHTRFSGDLVGFSRISCWLNGI